MSELEKNKKEQVGAGWEVRFPDQLSSLSGKLTSEWVAWGKYKPYAQI